ETVHDGDQVDVVARLTSRTFGGYESLQLDIRDVASSGLHDAPAQVDIPAVGSEPAVGGGLTLPVAS
ncbi:MAG TPA: hypothetical protein VHM48_12755, partial [Candidatus Limnocylindrales bacterium]|nr:hypothetical protein [Candidatus Limnocylindrales bacterium]